MAPNEIAGNRRQFAAPPAGQAASLLRQRRFSHAPTWAAGTALGGQRPTVVFDPLGDAYTGAAIEALQPRGRLVLFGTSAGPTGTIPLQSLYRKAVIVQGYAGLIESDEAMARAIRRTLDALANRRFSVAVADVLPLGDVNDAFDRIEQRALRGNLVLDNQKH